MQTNVTDTTRQSNFECLRIVSMAMIVIHHFIVHGMGHLKGGEVGPIIANSFVIVGVNCFVLISGYFRIKLRWDAILKFWLLCVFYGAVNLVVSIFLGEDITLKSIGSIFFISKCQSWFFPAYFYVMLLSPLLNSLDRIKIKYVHVIVALLVLYDCAMRNSAGYSSLHLIVIYVIGVWLNRVDIINRITKSKSIISYFAISALLAVITVVGYKYIGVSTDRFWGYNSLLVILASVAMFCFFGALTIKSRIINAVSASVVGVLFLQDVIFADRLYGYIMSAYESIGANLEFVLMLSMIFVLLFLVAFVIDSVRRFCSKRIINIVGRFIPQMLKFDLSKIGD